MLIVIPDGSSQVRVDTLDARNLMFPHSRAPLAVTCPFSFSVNGSRNDAVILALSTYGFAPQLAEGIVLDAYLGIEDQNKFKSAGVTMRDRMSKDIHVVIFLPDSLFDSLAKAKSIGLEIDNEEETILSARYGQAFQAAPCG